MRAFSPGAATLLPGLGLGTSIGALLPGPDWRAPHPAPVSVTANWSAEESPRRLRMIVQPVGEGWRLLHFVPDAPIGPDAMVPEDRESLALLRSIARHADDAILVTLARPIRDRGPRIVYVNEAFTRQTGWAAEEIIGRTPRVLQGPDTDRTTLDRIAEALEHWRPIRAELVNYRKDGTPVCVEINIVPVTNDEGVYTHWLSVQRDITQRRLDMGALQRAKDDAEEAAELTRRFVATMSHEMRGSLDGIIGLAGLLIDSGLDEMQRRIVGTLADTSDFLLQLMNDVLDYSKLGAGMVEIEHVPFDLARTAAAVRDLLLPRAEQKGVAIEITFDPAMPRMVIGDPSRVRQVLMNLIGNAVKFTEQGQVSVGFERVERRPDQRIVCACVVRDTGIGIAPEKLPRLFEAFAQADESISRRYGGTGLGLAISKRLVEAMGGGINVESRPGVGSAFRFTIELSEAAGDQVEGGAASDPIARFDRPPRILLAEDNRTNQMVMLAVLERLGCHVVIAETGREALERVRADPPDLVLMDVSMPEMDGLQATKAIRALPEPAARVPIIALTGNVMRRHQEACIAAGMDAFLSKPVGRDRLVGLIVEMLGARRQPDTAAHQARDALPAAAPSAQARRDPRFTLDRDELTRLIDGIGPAFDEIRPVFESDIARRVAAIGDALEAGDARKLAREAHSLKSASASFGFRRVSRYAAAIERGATRLDPSRIRRVLPRIIGEIETAQKALDQFLTHGH